jgi:hypothetical protein
MAGWLDEQAAEIRALARRDDVHTAALAVDPRHWQALRFVLWRDVAADAEATERYRVLHLSAPGLDALPEGRVW